jgi:hypothetical protein
MLKITGRLFESFIINAAETNHDDFHQYFPVIALLPTEFEYLKIFTWNM